MEELKKLRFKIDILDEEIIKLLEERMEICKEIGKLKDKIEDNNREKEIIKNLNKKFPNLDKELIDELYGVIFKYSKKIQK